MDSRLAQLASLSQRDKGPAYVLVLNDLFANQSSPSFLADLHTLVDTVVNQDAGGLVVGRQVVSELVKAVTGVVQDPEVKKQILQDTLNLVQPKIVSYEEHVNSIRLQLAELFESEEEWSDAARILMGLSLDSSQRSIPDQEKLQIYIRIVRLLLEDEDNVQAETYYNRAALLVHSTDDKATLLAYKLCQARIMDYSRKFLEAATRYHELSWVAEIDEEERQHMLSAAVTCGVLAPAGPNRSRVLGSLCRDERTADLPSFNILQKMFLDRILRSAEVKDFEGTLKPHQLARVALSSNDRVASAMQTDDDANDPTISKRTGPSTVLDRAVMEHNLLASSKIYNNITFKGLGALLDLSPSAAENMARKMIEQGRLKGSIDQVDKLIWFEASKEEDDAQGKAGGLGDVEQTTEDTGALFTKRWDQQIRITAANVESIVQNLTEKGLVTVN